MRLTENDVEILLNWGYPKEDLEQIELATLERFTTYEINGKKATLKKVLDIMDRTEYLSGIARSAFHWTSVRRGRNGEEIYFNSHNLFK